MNDRAAIENLVARYAERIDAGDFEGIAVMFSKATVKASVAGALVDSPLPSARMVHLYDGSPRTKHVTTNLIIDVGDDGTATCRSYYTVLQALPELPLQPIVAGRYHDRFVLDAGKWRFDERIFFVDLVGDLSHHLRQRLV